MSTQDEAIIAARRRVSLPESVYTPWGFTTDTTIFAEGIVFYTAKEHSGFKLSEERLQEMHPAVRDACKGGRWFEEDVDWSLVAVAFPELFTKEEVEQAEQTCKEWRREAYEALQADRSPGYLRHA